MVITYSLKFCNIYFTGSVGYWLRTLLDSQSLIWCATLGSVVNLAIIAIERSLKVVHAASSMNKLRNWMICSAMAFVWIAPFTSNLAIVFSTSAVIDGACYGYAIWASQMVRLFYSIWNVVFYYVAIILIFIICYWRILIVIRRQAKVMASHNAAGSSTAQTQAQGHSHQIQSNIIKVMIFVSAFYAISNLPANVLLFYMAVSPNPIPFGGVYYVSTIMTFLYVCTNPFIYAIKFDPVRKVLLRLKSSE